MSFGLFGGDTKPSVPSIWCLCQREVKYPTVTGGLSCVSCRGLQILALENDNSLKPLLKAEPMTMSLFVSPKRGSILFTSVLLWVSLGHDPCHSLCLCGVSTMFPGSYVPRYLCSPVPMFPGTDVPRFLYFNSRL